MIESINFRTGISSSLLQTTQATLADLPRRFYAPSRNQTPNSAKTAPSSPRSIAKNRQRWSRDAKLLKLDLPKQQTLEPNLNPRQWLLTGNPRLARLVTATIGDRWMTHLEDLQQLAPLAEDPLFQSQWQAIKQTNKQVLANAIDRSQGIQINVDSLFDVQLDPIGGHHRQLLNILHIIDLFDRLKQNPDLDIVPRTFIFGDVNASDPNILNAGEDNEELASSRERQETILLIESLGRVLAADPDVCDKLQVVYVPESAALTDRLYAAADVTQQLATAALEDVDLGKLQAVINGVISIGSLGKTNTWLQQIVGAENCFRFGLAIPEIALFKEYGYDPYNYYKHYPQIRQTIDWLLSGHFTPDVPGLCKSIVDRLMGTDDRLVLADYIFYLACQSQVSQTYSQTAAWTRMSIMNVASVK